MDIYGLLLLGGKIAEFQASKINILAIGNA